MSAAMHDPIMQAMGLLTGTDPLANAIVAHQNEKGRADKLQARLDAIAQYCADETDGDSPIRDGLLAHIAEMAEGRTP